MKVMFSVREKKSHIGFHRCMCKVFALVVYFAGFIKERRTKELIRKYVNSSSHIFSDEGC